MAVDAQSVVPSWVIWNAPSHRTTVLRNRERFRELAHTTTCSRFRSRSVAGPSMESTESPWGATKSGTRIRRMSTEEGRELRLDFNKLERLAGSHVIPCAV